MDVHWLVEVGVFPDTAARVIAAIEARGLRWTRHPDGAAPPDDACVLFWGSLGCAYDERVAARWSPGAIGDLERFRCRSYLAELGALVANADVVLTTARALVDRPDEVLAPLGRPSRVFVRPDSAAKPFSGRVVDVAALDLAALDHGFYYDDEQLPVVVARARTIGREWRAVIADGAVVAGCEYAVARRGIAAALPDDVRALAGVVAAAAWQAAPLYVVDVAEVDGALAVIELNPFSGADLYQCDADAVVVAASRVAARLHARG